MGDSNLHSHKRVPFFIAGRAGGASKRPLADAMLGLLHALGRDDLERFWRQRICLRPECPPAEPRTIGGYGQPYRSD
jgi:hypothetical protein